ncbi:PcfJ domain-containing protein [Roseovarius sp. MMSF_3281]|uniref:PcfJ domain-containing protein n=1 Tax=Roseovarius sp. MMSF_3281 TaxID=3046694 RepID=UPI0027401B26|nr:PcfJ domain-containing protein [Roseovarius sp. MMSF_3281]
MTQQEQSPQDQRILEGLFPEWKPRPVCAWVRKSGLGRSHLVLSALSLMGGTVERLEAVGGEQVVPILLWFREDVPQVRRRIGKAAWREVHHSTIHHNGKRLALMVKYGWTFEEVMQVPAWAWRYVTGCYASEAYFRPAVLWAVSCPAPHSGSADARSGAVESRVTLYLDSEQMCVSVNPAWSEARMRREHDREAMEQARADADPTPWAEPWVHEVDGYRFTLLRSERDFAEEGLLMRHCIRSYASAARQMRTVVLRIEGAERGTCNMLTKPFVHPSGGVVSATVRIDQVQGFANTSLTKAARAAAFQAFEAYNENRFATDYRGIHGGRV